MSRYTSALSTVAEIRDAISKLSEQARKLLVTELFATVPLPHEDDPAFLAKLDAALAESENGATYSIEKVHVMIPQWISGSRSHQAS